MSITKVRPHPSFVAKVRPMYDAMEAMRAYIESRPKSPYKAYGHTHYDWPDEMKQLIADFIVAAEKVIPVWESIQVRVERGLKAAA